MTTFTIFPAIDLRNGQVVRLSQGDPNQQKTYSTNPAAVARNMLEQGAKWLHIVNLDGAFGESSNANMIALSRIIGIAREFRAGIQFGGGLHTIGQVKDTLAYGVSRVVLGSMAVKKPKNISLLLQEYDPHQIAVSLDGRNKKVMVSGWKQESDIGVFDLAANLKSMGLIWLVYTDIERDGMQIGSDFETTVSLARETGMNIIASGGVSTVTEVENLKNQGIAGAIVGRALYEGTMNLADLLAIADREKD
jgi:phosphoribosylformimino-5-aminoimidazole carboxamide ribotide isomerase